MAWWPSWENGAASEEQRGEAGPLQSEGQPAWSVSLRPGRGAGAQFPASRAAHPRSPRRGLAAGGRGRRTRAVRDEAEAGPSAAHLPRPASSRSPHRHPQIHRVLCAAKATGERPHPSYGGAADGTAHSSRGTPDGPGSSSLSSGLCLLEPSGLGLRVTEHASVIYSPSTHGSRQLPARVGQALPTTELMRAAPATTTPARLP